ncbi:hypothetical protein bas03_0025 [Escherichia phage JulesPiccard]|uniref:HNH nuclease domain-containing protein n=1 Tax=Escherichia phage JulesPiccard TaxID=2851956 RepID=A0AAE7VVC7_9CAUD|nr:hypothetical protein bas03_0025 [Escherichia phage JulesPiccard]
MNWNDYFRYESGNLYWLTKRKGVRASGLAGYSRKDGYVQVRVSGKAFLAHRIIWEMHNGLIPEGMEIDHINHNPGDNSIENLRVVTCKDNQMNRPIRLLSKSGFNGVTWHKKSKKWQATARVNGKTRYFGLFDDPIDASKAMRSFFMENNFHPNHGEKRC